jgi:hypothetical protein
MEKINWMTEFKEINDKFNDLKKINLIYETTRALYMMNVENTLSMESEKKAKNFQEKELPKFRKNYPEHDKHFMKMMKYNDFPLFSKIESEPVIFLQKYQNLKKDFKNLTYRIRNYQESAPDIFAEQADHELNKIEKACLKIHNFQNLSDNE